MDDIRRKLNQVRSELSEEQVEEQEIITSLNFLMFGRDSEELPKEFDIECIMDNESISNFLRERLKLNVKEVNLILSSLIFGKPKFHVVLY